jgi:hypothetical protein
VTFEDRSLHTWLGAVAELLVLSPWLLLAVRTTDFLKFVTSHKVPFPKRTIWLAKVLGLILGAGGVFAVSNTLGLPWYLALLPTGTFIVFAFGENVEEVIPPKPAQDASAYHSAWKEYQALRGAYVRSQVWVGATILSLIVLIVIGRILSETAGSVLMIIWFAAVIFSGAMNAAGALRFFRWPCPRCGCAFNGMWIRPWFPKKCAYCGLQRESGASVNGVISKHTLP